MMNAKHQHDEKMLAKNWLFVKDVLAEVKEIVPEHLLLASPYSLLTKEIATLFLTNDFTMPQMSL